MVSRPSYLYNGNNRTWKDRPYIEMAPRAPSQYPKRRLIVRSREVSKPRDWYFKLSHRFEIWQAHRQQCCRSACQISERSDNSKYLSRAFETSRDLAINVFSDIETGPWQDPNDSVPAIGWDLRLSCQITTGTLLNDMQIALTHLHLVKMATISQTILSDAFSWMKNFVFWYEFHWSLFLRLWPGTEYATSHYLDQCRPNSLTHICGTRGRWVNSLYHFIGMPCFSSYMSDTGESRLETSKLFALNINIKTENTSMYMHLYIYVMIC